MNIPWDRIAQLAPNEAALRNGKSLSGKLIALNVDQDDTLLFGICPGSGATPYHVSVDFSGAEPLSRCSCPSRQTPCKHALALLCAVADGKRPVRAEVPEDVRLKREKAQQRAARRDSEPTDAPPKPKRANSSAKRKRIEAQIEALRGALSQFEEIAALGIATLGPAQIRAYQAEAESLKGRYLPGVAARYHAFLLRAREADESTAQDAAQRLANLHSLARRGIDQLQARLDAKAYEPDASSPWEERLGYAWQLEELRAAGRVVENATLVQLFFEETDDPGARQWADEGLWIDIADGRLLRTQNLRPYRAAKHIAQEDSAYAAMVVPELFVYPGDVCPRARWNGDPATRAIAPDEMGAIRSHAKDASVALPEVRKALRDPLIEEVPCLLRTRGLVRTQGGWALATDAGHLPLDAASELVLALLPAFREALVSLRVAPEGALVARLLCAMLEDRLIPM